MIFCGLRKVRHNPLLALSGVYHTVTHVTKIFLVIVSNHNYWLGGGQVNDQVGHQPGGSVVDLFVPIASILHSQWKAGQA